MITLNQRSLTQIDRRDTFETENAPRFGRNLMRAANYLKSSENQLNLCKIYNFVSF
jgi:hypothetical protein